ncbi:hypothetical protein B0H17DRAFT_1212996 [Mycena rosella]|uniref:Uncharacterized protein n=1 Tax=Mycena rosella TaxID=1033263 RepID=A0AAD7CRA6_MYCRO|nr:hypothetical protein B0H17DRAFT_1212996 [Mycena rosella]
MSDHPEQPKSKFRDGVKAGWHKVEDSGTLTAALSNPTPAPFNTQGSSPGATARLPSNTESAPSQGENGEDSSKGGDTAKTDTSDTAQESKSGSDVDINRYLKSTHALPDPDWQPWKIDDKSISPGPPSPLFAPSLVWVFLLFRAVNYHPPIAWNLPRYGVLDFAGGLPLAPA